MFHIVFDNRGAELITAAMDLDEALDGETLAITDDFSVGPIQDIFSVQGLEDRKKWWSKIKEEAERPQAEIESDADNKLLVQILQRMEEEEFEQIWIWVAPNARDMCGYYWLIGQLQNFAGRVFVVHLNNLPFINDKGNIFYPVFLSEIPSREFIKARKLARPVTTAEFETDPDEWTRMASENKILRVLEGGKKIIQYEEDHFDQPLLNYLQPSFQKIPKTAHHFLSKSPEKANESFLIWRLKQLVSSGVVEQQGDMVRQPVKTIDEFSG